MGEPNPEYQPDEQSRTPHPRGPTGASGNSWQRRDLLKGAAALTAGSLVLLGRRRHDHPAVAAEMDLLLNAGATATASAVRGEMVQIIPPPPPPVHWHPGQFITHVDVVDRRMALTFDDGPSPYNTPSLLRTLAANGIKATFFLVGVNVRSFPALARNIVEEGHEIGNHSVYHTPYESVALAGQIGPNQAIIRDATGVTPIVNRAPGLTRGNSILNACAAYGLYEAHTDMSTFDWLSPRHSASTLFDEFVRYQHNGAIVLYHDGGNRRPTPDALASIISYARSIGYTFVTATELVNSGTPQPGTYSSLSSELTAGGPSNPDQAAQELTGYVDRCGYDAEAELVQMLASDDAVLTSADRSRIGDALADLQAAKQG